MASKVLVKMPTVPFPQVKNPEPDPVQSSSSGNYSSEQVRAQQPLASPKQRVEQATYSRNLDPVVRFLQEQHQLMLAGLHTEIESLKQRNRELQFQLVFSKNGTNPPNSIPSSPEDDSKSQASLSPKIINEAPLQVELLEKELSETKLSLQHANTRTACLAALVDEQNKKLEALRASAAEEVEPDPDLQHALHEAERLVRCLRRENDEQRRELTALRAAVAGQECSMQTQGSQQGSGLGQQRAPRGRHQHNNPGSGGPANGGNGRHQGGRQGGGQYEQQPRFPPLQTQSYWHQRGGGRGGGGRHNMGQDKPPGNMQLPNLRAGPSAGGYHFNGNNGHRRGSYYNSNGNHGNHGHNQQHNRGNYQHHKNEERDVRPDREPRYEREKERDELADGGHAKSPRNQPRNTNNKS